MRSEVAARQRLLQPFCRIGQIARMVQDGVLARCTGEKVTWFPTRLLHFTNETVQLIETRQTRPTTPYMTVTHRWGFADEEKVTLNRNTYPSLKKGIPLSSMPRLFHEVINVALHLGVSYIWIDSFCIFQDKDDQTDWRREATKMQMVYSNSFCNISADDAISCSDTLFSEPRNPEEIIPQKVHISPGLSDSLETGQSLTIIDFNLWATQVDCSLVNSRGWVLQERVLSRRILHFGRRQLFWECKSVEACEAIPVPIRMPSGPSESYRVRFKQSVSLAPGRRLENPYEIWHKMVRLYTKTELSFPSDKLVAISGLAKLFRDWTGDDYLAGLWRRNLEGELLWSNDMPQYLGEKETTKRPKQYRAPSWSWASVDGPLRASYPRLKDHCLEIKVEDVQLSYLTEDKTGEVTSGWLRLRGRLLETELVGSRRRLGTLGGIVKLEGVNVPDEEYKAISGFLHPRVLLDVVQEDFESENKEQLLFSMLAA